MGQVSPLNPLSVSPCVRAAAAVGPARDADARGARTLSITHVRRARRRNRESSSDGGPTSEVPWLARPPAPPSADTTPPSASDVPGRGPPRQFRAPLYISIVILHAKYTERRDNDSNIYA